MAKAASKKAESKEPDDLSNFQLVMDLCKQILESANYVEGAKTGKNKELVDLIIATKNSTYFLVESKNSELDRLHLFKKNLGKGQPKKMTIPDYNQYLISLVRKGVPRTTLDQFMDYSGITTTEMATIFHVSDRTLRRHAPGATLTEDQSEKLVGLTALYSKGAEVFGDIERFKSWMDQEQLVFGNQKPKTFLDTTIGMSLIMDELGQIEHGIFA